MGKNSKIEWTNYTWNPWYGCRKCDALCRFCYMFRDMPFYGKDPNVVTRSGTFYDPLKWSEPGFCFTCSWSDWFIEEADEWRDEAWSIIKRTPQITYQVLTKRTERIADHLPADWGDGYPNVWLGFSAGTQASFEKRWSQIVEQRLRARVFFLSAEPLIERLTIKSAVPQMMVCRGPRKSRLTVETAHALSQLARAATRHAGAPMIDWVVTGGETGKLDEEIRPSHPKWFRELRDETINAGIPFFFKQWGDFGYSGGCDDPCGECFMLSTDGQRTGFDWEPGPHLIGSAQVHRIGRKKTGRLLDGREWNEMPEAN